jgi:hypothetical protein
MMSACTFLNPISTDRALVKIENRKPSQMKNSQEAMPALPSRTTSIGQPNMLSSQSLSRNECSSAEVARIEQYQSVHEFEQTTAKESTKNQDSKEQLFLKGSQKSSLIKSERKPERFRRTHRPSLSTPVFPAPSSLNAFAVKTLDDDQTAMSNITKGKSTRWWEKISGQVKKRPSLQDINALSAHLELLSTESLSGSTQSIPAKPHLLEMIGTAVTAETLDASSAAILPFTDAIKIDETDLNVQIFEMYEDYLRHDLARQTRNLPFDTIDDAMSWADDPVLLIELRSLRQENQTFETKLQCLSEEIQKEIKFHQATLRHLQLYSSPLPISMSTSYQPETNIASGKKDINISVPHSSPRSAGLGRHKNSSSCDLSAAVRRAAHQPPAQLRGAYEASIKAFFQSTLVI